MHSLGQFCIERMSDVAFGPLVLSFVLSFAKILIAIQQALCSRPRKIESTYHFHSKSECDYFFFRKGEITSKEPGKKKDLGCLKTCATDYVYC